MNLKVRGLSLSPTQCGCSPALNPGGFSFLYLRSGCCTSAVSVWGITLVSKAAGKISKTHSCSPSWRLEVGRGWKGSLLKGKVLAQVPQNPVLWRCEWPTASLGPCSVFDHPHGENFFHRANENFLFSSWWLIASHPV